MALPSTLPNGGYPSSADSYISSLNFVDPRPLPDHCYSQDRTQHAYPNPFADRAPTLNAMLDTMGSVQQSQPGDRVQNMFDFSLNESIRANMRAVVSHSAEFANQQEPEEVEPFQDAMERAIIFSDGYILCPFPNCRKTFARAASYRIHRAHFHGLASHNCITCLAPFADSKALAEHMGKMKHFILCPLCSARFKKPETASCHYTIKHKRFSCVFCSCTLFGSLEQKNHYQYCTGAPSEENYVGDMSSLVETTLNSSFVGTEEEVQVLGESGQRNLENIQLRDKTHRTPAKSNLCEDTTRRDTFNVSAPHNSMGTGSDTDTADTEVLSDAETIIIDFDTGDNDAERHTATQSVEEAADDPSCNLTFGPGSYDLFGGYPESANYLSQDSNDPLLSSNQEMEYEVEPFLIYKDYTCSTCGHNLLGLKTLMIHEMYHRLSNAFKRKVEHLAWLDLFPDQNTFDCTKCGEKLQSVSLWQKHEIWHNWPAMWQSFVLKQSCEGVFTEEDAKQMKKLVEDELKVQWRDLSEENEVSSRITKVQACSEAQSSSEANPDHDHDWDDTSTLEDSSDEREDECEAESESSVGPKSAINSWMSYWLSYLGIDGTPPSWVSPIINDLRSQWRNYDAKDHDALYRKMDQIATIVRAHKNRISSSEGPWVRLERLPASLMMPPDTAVETTFSSCESSKGHNTRKRPHISCHTERLGAKVQKSTSKVHKAEESHNTPVQLSLKDKIHINSMDKRRNTTGQDTRRPLPSAQLSLRGEMIEDQDLGMNQDEILKSPVHSPLERQPVVLLSRLKRPNEPGHQHAGTEAKRAKTLSSGFNFSKYAEKLTKELHKPIPRWALALMQSIASDLSLSDSVKMAKINQVASLIKTYFGHPGTLMPVVRLNRI